MARCKLTNMNLRNIRKTREYQCLVIDLVNTGVMTKSSAEGLLGYTIPAGLLASGSVVVPDDEDEPGTGGEGTGGEGTGGEGTGGEGTGGETGGETAESVTLAVNLISMAAVLGKGSGSGRTGGESDGWLLVNFPLPEDPADRWFTRANNGATEYNSELLGDMYGTIKDAVVITGGFTEGDFINYFPAVTGGDPTLPYPVVANEGYQIGEDIPPSRFTAVATDTYPDALTDGMIFSYTPITSDGPSVSPISPTN